MENKRGNVASIIILIGLLFVLLIGGMILAFGGLVANWTADVVIPEISTLGQVGSSNLTEVAEYTIAPANTIVQSFTFMGGLLYAIGLIVCIGLAFAFRFTGNKWMAGLFIMMMVILIISSIFISNIYEDFYNGGGDVQTYLHEQVLLSYLILYAPVVFTVLGFICRIIMFTGDGEESVVI